MRTLLDTALIVSRLRQDVGAQGRRTSKKRPNSWTHVSKSPTLHIEHSPNRHLLRTMVAP